MANSDIYSTFFLGATVHLTNKATIKLTWKNDEPICTEQWPLTKEKLQATKELMVRLVKAIVFPVVMYGCESWTLKKAERRRIDAFKLWCWRRLLRVPWTVRRSNQSILKIKPWGFFRKNDVEAETPVLWPPHAKS